MFSRARTGLVFRINGVPHRMSWFNRILDLLLARDDTVFMNGSGIADWYAAAEPAPAEMTR